MNKKLITVIIATGIVIFGCQKQVEHPGEEPGEHPSEHPEEKKESKITVEDIATAAENFVKSQYKDGYFIFTDNSTGKTLKLKLDKIHRERLSPIGNNTYFVCADFIAEDGTKYDLDFFMKGSDVESLKVYDITIHKINGKPLYTWVKVGDIWQRKYD